MLCPCHPSTSSGTVVFLIFLSDWAGYVGTTGLLVYQGVAVSDGDDSGDKFKDIFIWVRQRRHRF